MRPWLTAAVMTLALSAALLTAAACGGSGKISGTSAVNTYGGPYTEGPGDAFSVGDLASTMMAGPEPDMRAEQAYLKLLSQVESCKLTARGLTLFDQNGNESLIFTAAKP